ncbi:hypothetical protein EZV62_020906 [Acer yangbiense]|uniref:PGG domain-containing protein n=1 Tax=Acer yangbiense TaxID=1000413 RepID=A0A5C7HF39_9ROSI|nr:hypothetical protein EZV62_020906 [Acer yangbiense]
MASIKGRLPIVTDLLNFDKELCFLKDSEGRTPLHGAAIKGRLEVITHLMSSCPESAMEVADKGETLLHLVVNNGQKEALVLLISSLRELNLLHKLIDRINEDGKTALQLAIASDVSKPGTIKRFESTRIHPNSLGIVQRALADCDRVAEFRQGLCFVKDSEVRTPLHCAAIKGRVEVITHLMYCCPGSVMEVTDKGETLLHLVVNNGQKEAMMTKMLAIETVNGDETNKQAVVDIDKNQNQMSKMLSSMTENGHDDETKKQAVPSSSGSGGYESSWKDRLETLHSAIIVVCSVLATCCFEAIISPPGGVWQTRPSNDVIHKENIKNISAFQRGKRNVPACDCGNSDAANSYRFGNGLIHNYYRVDKQCRCVRRGDLGHLDRHMDTIELGDQLILDIMDTRLHVAACNGDVGALQELLQEDPLVLSKAIMSTSSDSPLHLAALLGHTNFAKLVMSRNPELSRDLNQQRYTPIHLASLKGHLQIVTELLNFDKGLLYKGL